MPDAVAVIETLGFPAILAASDAMVKAAQVTIVWCDRAESGRFVVAARGHVAEAKRAQEAGIAAAEAVYGGQVITHYLVPNPPENVVSVLPLEYTEVSAPFRCR